MQYQSFPVTKHVPEAVAQQKKITENSSCSSSKKLQETPRKEDINHEIPIFKPSPKG